jgi:hypothetical protein
MEKKDRKEKDQKVKDQEDAKRRVIEFMREKLPDVVDSIEANRAEITMREYSRTHARTRKKRDVYELVVKEQKKAKIKEREIEILKITIGTIDKDTGEIKISIKG